MSLPYCNQRIGQQRRTHTAHRSDEIGGSSGEREWDLTFAQDISGVETCSHLHDSDGSV